MSDATDAILAAQEDILGQLGASFTVDGVAGTKTGVIVETTGNELTENGIEQKRSCEIACLASTWVPTAGKRFTVTASGRKYVVESFSPEFTGYKITAVESMA